MIKVCNTCNFQMHEITLIISAAIVCISSAPVNEDAQALILNFDVTEVEITSSGNTLEIIHYTEVHPGIVSYLYRM